MIRSTRSIVRMSLIGMSLVGMSLVGMSLVLYAVPQVGRADESRIDFNRDIRPILNEHCTKCHGGVRQAADVSFIYRDRTLDSGIIIPGQPNDSELISRVTSDDPDVQMPPPSERHGRLAAADVQRLEQWITEGAAWGTHWSFEKPMPPSVPDTSQPQWVRRGLDAFVLQRLDAEELEPSPEAPPAEWLRRARFDLTGLPPTPSDIANFMRACSQSSDAREDAYAAEVDRMLSSQQYGERWAEMWMDLARYADTKGYEKDPHRDMWPYRDWLIRAFNQDMPFDEFTMKQLAGDLLAEPTADDLVATAFHRNTQTNTEGGTDDEEFRVAAVIDRINSTWTIWQATTFGCVQCHSHPYDPFQHSEYYAFMAFFNSTEDHDFDDDYPTFALPGDPEEASRATQLDRRRRELRVSLNDASLAAADATQWVPLSMDDVQTSHGRLKTDEDHHVRVAGGTFPPGCVYTVTAPAPKLTAVRVEILPESDDPKTWPETGCVLSKLELSLALPDGEAQELVIKEVFADYLAGPYDARDSIRDGAAGFGGYPKLEGPRWAVFVLDKPLSPPELSTLVIKLKQDAQVTGARAVHLRHFSIATSESPQWTQIAHDSKRAEQWKQYGEMSDQRAQLAGPSLPIIRQREAAATRPTRVFVRGNWLEHGDIVSAAVPSIFPSIRRSTDSKVPSPPPAQRNSGGEGRVRGGEFLSAARRNVDAPNRLALANWLVSAENPLTARVLANRLWAELFGTGIVETQENFGSTGTPPSHPALLDHLAIRLQHDHTWHLKSFLKELVLSSTYRQSHRVTAELRERDPGNRLLARGPRTRLSAEMIRDQALTASGLLSDKIGGPSVMPPQPEGVWRTVYSDAKWVTAEGPDRYRRGLYTYWRRTSPYPSFVMFDAPSREFCTARRISTNTPLQALVTLNDPVFTECAAALAKQATKHGGTETRDHVRWAYEAVTSQNASDTVLNELERLYEAAVDQYPSVTTDDATRSADSASDYALSLVASTILNLDAALNK